MAAVHHYRDAGEVLLHALVGDLRPDVGDGGEHDASVRGHAEVQLVPVLRPGHLPHVVLYVGPGGVVEDHQDLYQHTEPDTHLQFIE